MTGYGRSEIASDYLFGYVEIRSKNHRYREIRISLPPKYYSFEIPLQKILTKRIHRGKIDLSVQINSYLKPNYSLSLNKELLGEYKKIFDELKSGFDDSAKIDLTRMVQLKDIIVTIEDNEVLKEHLSDIEKAVEKAIDSLDEMKSFEGEKLSHELISFMKKTEDMLDKIQFKRDELLSSYNEKIRKKIEAFVQEGNLDEQRLCQEIAYIVDKTDIAEEIARLKSHLRQFDNIIKEKEPIGKKLNFLFQEMNREINTISSKANDFDISSLVIEIKNELEKAREQVQNIE